MSAQSRLLHEVSRSVFWNTALLPLVTAVGVLLSVLVRRSFGLESGLYDVALGIVNSILFYSSLGLAGTLPKFLPELHMRASGRAAARLIWQLIAIRLAIVIAIVVPLNIAAETLAQALNLGSDGSLLLQWLTLLLVGRASLDFLYRVLDSFLQQSRVNALSLVNGTLDVCLAAGAVLLGFRIAGVIAALGVSALITTCVAANVVVRQVREIPERPDASPEALPLTRIWKLSLITYLRDVSMYFATPAFASPVLASVLGAPEPVALFAIGYFIAASTVALTVSGFRGVYRPVFARVLAADEPRQLQRAFDLMNKAQILAVVPAGFGLAVMVGDYLPLLYGDSFAAAIPIARLLVALMFAETVFAIAGLVLWADERYLAVLQAQSVIILAAPIFVWTANRFGLLAAAAVLGASRLGSSVIGYQLARQRYDIQYPWKFAGRVFVISSVMAGVLTLLRQLWGTSLVEATILTLVGVIIVAIGLRAFRVMESSDIEVLQSAAIPGRRWLVRWLTTP
jgi:O-antigen/teichoic acid export membrane protein